jgi:DNA invertase Pin-like site-specific DNA recombinase
MAGFVAYYRVSTVKQGQSGLGLEAQRAAVLAHVGRAGLLAEFTEVESGRKVDRPQLAAALRHCRATGATLVVAKLDRLARDVEFVAGILNSGVEFVACDCPQANRLTLHILSAMAEYEGRAIAQRTRDAMAAAKARGQTFGCPNGAAALRRAGKGNTDAVRALKGTADAHAQALRDMVADIRAGGVSTLSGIAHELERRGARTARGGRWSATQVGRLLARLQ